MNSDQKIMLQHVTIKLVPGEHAPHYPDGMELGLEECVITEQATQKRLPVVDFKMRGPDGKFYLLVLSGRIVNGIAAAVKGVNLRNHGVEEP